MFMSVLRKGLVGAASLAGGVAVLNCATATPASAHASNLDARISRIEDEAAIKRLVDTFSNLADRKDIDTQVMLFTDDATVQSWVDGKPAPALKGRNELAKAFSGFLAQFTTVYHINGQQSVTINGDEATGTAYCLVVLISKTEGKAVHRTIGVRYDDRYVRENGKWLIADRTSHFEWTTIQEYPA